MAGCGPELFHLHLHQDSHLPADVLGLGRWCHTRLFDVSDLVVMLVVEKSRIAWSRIGQVRSRLTILWLEIIAPSLVGGAAYFVSRVIIELFAGPSGLAVLSAKDAAIWAAGVVLMRLARRFRRNRAAP